MSNDFIYDMNEINEETIMNGWEEMNDDDYMPGYDDGEWDPVMGDAEDHVETDDNWLDEFWGEEDFA